MHPAAHFESNYVKSINLIKTKNKQDKSKELQLQVQRVWFSTLSLKLKHYNTYPWAKNQQCLPWGAASESVQQCCWDLRLHLAFGGLELSYQLFVVNPCYHLFPQV